MSEKSAKAARVAAPPPILAGPPIPLPDTFQGGYAGAAVIFDLDRVLEFDYVAPSVMGAWQAERAALDAETPPEEADAATIRAFQRRRQTVNHHWAAARCAYLVWGFAPGPSVPRDDVEAWRALSQPVVRWIATEGIKRAVEQTIAPFLPSASPA